MASVTDADDTNFERPDITRSCCEYLTFSFVTPVLATGSERQLSEPDLLPVEESVGSAYERLLRLKDATPDTTWGGALWQLVKVDMFWMAFYKAVRTVTFFIGPYGMNLILDAINKREPVTVWEGTYLTLLFTIIPFVGALADHAHQRVGAKVGIVLKSTFAVYGGVLFALNYCLPSTDLDREPSSSSSSAPCSRRPSPSTPPPCYTTPPPARSLTSCPPPPLCLP